MLVVLILVAVALGPLWGRRLSPPKSYVATSVGWVVAMSIVIAGAAVSTTKSDDPDLGFWLFNALLLVVGLGLTALGGRRRVRAKVAIR